MTYDQIDKLERAANSLEGIYKTLWGIDQRGLDAVDSSRLSTSLSDIRHEIADLRTLARKA